jgi:eukaryotic-like serine/threonine-protein kinase
VSQADPKSNPTPLPGDSALPVSSSSDPAASASGESGGSRSGSSSDSVIGRLVVDKGLATQAEVDAAFAAMKTPAGQVKVFVDILVEGQIVTRRQLARLRTEAESDKSVLRIPGYQMIRKLGAGAMASVYLAKQTSLDRLVAIKILPRRYSGDANFIDRF